MWMCICELSFSKARPTFYPTLFKKKKNITAVPTRANSSRTSRTCINISTRTQTLLKLLTCCEPESSVQQGVTIEMLDVRKEPYVMKRKKPPFLRTWKWIGETLLRAPEQIGL